MTQDRLKILSPAGEILEIQFLQDAHDPSILFRAPTMLKVWPGILLAGTNLFQRKNWTASFDWIEDIISSIKGSWNIKSVA